VALALTRQMLMRNHAAAHPRQAHAVESLAMLHTSRNDGKEGVASFNDKRPAGFRRPGVERLAGLLSLVVKARSAA
jgi:predicted pyridoxine 5'-phosphate oxidase superfamily flavin-nucleotide-binding protein